jgi:hypothetical protein
MSARDRTIATVVAMLVVAIGGWFLLVAPKRSEASKLQTQVNAEQSNLRTAQASVQAGLVAERQYRVLHRQLASLQTAVPADSQIPTLINELQAAANKSKVGFQAVSLATSSSGSSTGSTSTSATTPAAASAAPSSSSSVATSFPSQTFTLQFSGRYFDVANLLGTLAGFVHADNKHFDATGRLLNMASVTETPGGKGINATVTTIDYDVPTSLLGAGA